MPTLTAAQLALGIDSRLTRIIAPYRVNPLGAHVDHQGGAVLAKTIDQHTVLSFQSNHDNSKSPNEFELISSQQHWQPNKITFQPGDNQHSVTWVRFAQAAVAAFNARYKLDTGFRGYVEGAQIGAGLSSSASVVLAYLTALAHCNDITLDQHQLVELSRQVENDFMGLNNGIQDQMSIVFGKKNALTLLDVNNVIAVDVPDPDNISEITWVLCYSGFDRELINSSFNTRVEECRNAATALDPQASILGEVRQEFRTDAAIASLPEILAKRARHFYSETARVNAGVAAWHAGDWPSFGSLMNQSCQSSITQYESGSPAMIELHKIASMTNGVYGSRFCGGGYGGCLLMLTSAELVEEVQQQVLSSYLNKFPEKENIARIFVASADSTVRIV